MIRPIRKLYQYFVDHPIEPEAIIYKRYQVEDVIGKGSYGIVYRCRDIETGYILVIKQLRPSKQRKTKEINLFMKEAELLSQLNHPNIPKFLEHFSDEGHYFYAMSFIEAENLEEAIFSRKKTFNEEESLLFVRHLVDIIAHLHGRRIYHLDLRIPNTLVKNEEPFLIDFGLANEGKMVTSVEALRLQDYYDLGDILLYLLYTTYPSQKKKALPWTEELILKEETVYLLKRLLRISKPYENLEEITRDFDEAIHANELV